MNREKYTAKQSRIFLGSSMRSASTNNSDHLKKQRKLLQQARQAGAPLADVLSRSEWSYDDLIYAKSRTKRWKGPKPPTLDEMRTGPLDVPFVSFFTGCGGMDLGFEAAGYRHLAAFEINELFCKTLRHNRPEWRIFGPPTHSGDVSKFDEVANVLGRIINTPFDGVFAGGPPCQPFSIASNQRFPKRTDKYKRTGFLHETNGNLLFDYLRLIVFFKPKAFVIENVPGLRDIDGGEQLSEAMTQLRANGYDVIDPLVIDAADYNVPQTRNRLFVIGHQSSGSGQIPLSENIGSADRSRKRAGRHWPEVS